MDGDEVGGGDEPFEVRRFSAQCTDPVFGNVGVMGEHAHVESEPAAGHLRSDWPEANDAERLAANFGADVALAVPLACAHGGVGLGHMAGEGHEQCDCVLGGRDGVALWSIYDNDAALRGSFQVDVVNAHAGPADDLQARACFDDRSRHLGFAADDKGVVVLDGGDERIGSLAGLHFDVADRPEKLDAFGGDRVCDQDARAAFFGHSLGLPQRFQCEFDRGGDTRLSRFPPADGALVHAKGGRHGGLGMAQCCPDRAELACVHVRCSMHERRRPCNLHGLRLPERD